jgi:endoglucanase
VRCAPGRRSDSVATSSRLWPGVAGALLAIVLVGSVAVVRMTAAAGAPPAHDPVDHNLLQGSTASLSSSLGSWVAVSGVVSWSPHGADNSGALELDGGPQGVVAGSGSPSTGGVRPAVPGVAYHGTASARSSGGPRQVVTGLAFFDADGNTLDMLWGPVTNIGSASWTPLTPVTAIAPTGSAGVAFVVGQFGDRAGANTLVDRPTLSSAEDDSEVIQGPLRVSGNRLLDSAGNQVVLRGIDASGLESSGDPENLTEDTVAQFKAWGANVVRVDLGEQLWLSNSCAYDPSYAAAVDQVVDWITSLGMVALLDLHSNNAADLDPSSSGTCPEAGQQLMADDPGSLQFWSDVARRYADNPLVAFDLYNEPHDISGRTWLDGGRVGTGSTAFHAAGMQQLYDAVRATGARNVVVVSGNGWGSVPPTSLVSGYNIVYGAHAYTCALQPPPECQDPTPDDPLPVLNSWIPLSTSEPVMVTEFGFPNQNDALYNANVTSFADAHGWGWDVYTWDGTNHGEFDLIQGSAVSDTVEPAPSAMALVWVMRTQPDTIGLSATSSGLGRRRRASLPATHRRAKRPLAGTAEAGRPTTTDHRPAHQS